MKVIYPGSFDPITNGHIDVVSKGLRLFGEVTILVMSNEDKDHLFDIDRRVKLVNQSLEQTKLADKVNVINYTGWISRFIEESMDEDVIIIRGLRNSTDLDYEMMYESFTKQFGAQTVYVSPSPESIFTSSSLIRNLILAGGDYLKYVPWKKLP